MARLLFLLCLLGTSFAATQTWSDTQTSADGSSWNDATVTFDDTKKDRLSVGETEYTVTAMRIGQLDWKVHSCVFSATTGSSAASSDLYIQSKPAASSASINVKDSSPSSSPKYFCLDILGLLSASIVLGDDSTAVLLAEMIGEDVEKDLAGSLPVVEVDAKKSSADDTDFTFIVYLDVTKFSSTSADPLASAAAVANKGKNEGTKVLLETATSTATHGALPALDEIKSTIQASITKVVKTYAGVSKTFGVDVVYRLPRTKESWSSLQKALEAVGGEKKLSADVNVDAERRHHRHHHHHHRLRNHHQEAEPRFTHENLAVYGLGGGLALAGGVQISDEGTLGGLLIDANNENFQLYGLTNAHVAAQDEDVVQPDGGAAFGKVSYAIEDDAVADISMIKIAQATRYNAKCAVLGAGQNPEVKLVTGTKTIQETKPVKKYGSRTHFTTGTVLHRYTGVNGDIDNDWNSDFTIVSSTVPAFADGTPTNGENRLNMKARISPANELTFFDAEIRDKMVPLIQAMPATRQQGCAADVAKGYLASPHGTRAGRTDCPAQQTAVDAICADGTWIDSPCAAAPLPCPGNVAAGTVTPFVATGPTKVVTSPSICGNDGVVVGGTEAENRFSTAEAREIFDALYQADLITLFSSPGDSGSWVMDDDGVSVVGLFVGGEVEMLTSGNQVNKFGQDWYGVRKFGFAFDIDRVVAWLQGHGPVNTISVCTTTNRPAAPDACVYKGDAQPPRCEYPMYCKLDAPVVDQAPTCSLRTDLT